jgi:uncharacterized DUF497 family protein
VKIKRLIWSDERIAHIARHEVLPEEFEEICLGKPRALRTEAHGSNPVYQLFGQTAEGRYLVCFVIEFPDNNGFPITARPMTQKERRYFSQKGKR